MPYAVSLVFLIWSLLWVILLPTYCFLYSWKKKSIEWSRKWTQLVLQFSIFSSFVLPTYLLSFLLACIIFWGVWEFLNLLKKTPYSPRLRLIYLVSPSLIPICMFYEPMSLLFLGVGLTYLFWLLFILEKKTSEFFERVGHFLSMILIALMLSSIVLLHDQSQGFELCVFAYALAAFSDVTAYIIGGAFGKLKIAPGISPNKTVEGILGSLVCTVILAFFMQRHLLYNHSLPLILSAAFFMCLSAHFGDLVFSMMKRSMGTKDFSNFFPGIGGVWDILDSLVFTAPVFYLILVLYA